MSSDLPTDAAIAIADGIMTLDPETANGETVWGSDRLASIRAPGTPPYQLNMLNLWIAQEDWQKLGQLLDRVLRIRGRLPAPMMHLLARLPA